MNKTYISKNPAYLMPKNFKEKKTKENWILNRRKQGQNGLRTKIYKVDIK
jgi:hypothetical protein